MSHDCEMKIRAECKADEQAVFEVNAATFPTLAEANIVEALRKGASPVLSLVAECGGKIVAHIMFSPMTVPGESETKIMGLAPVAVVPEVQRSGVGKALVEAGLESCRRLGIHAVVVLGHPEYYPKFGFVPASRYGIRCEYDVPDEAFMALELVPGALRGISGTVRYHEAFGGV